MVQQSDDGMKKECWCAFALSLMYIDYITPETAFDYLEKGRRKKSKFESNRVIVDADVQDMAKMRYKEGMSWGAIGSLYGLSTLAARRRILRYKNKMGAAI